MKKIYEFWQKQADKNQFSGTEDVLLDALEQEIIEKNISNNCTILEIGCGDGRNAINLAKKKNVCIHAFDFSEKMIELAKSNAVKENVKIKFFLYDINEIENLSGKYSFIISKRALINLPSTYEQKLTLSKISGLLEDNGVYLMCESSSQGLHRINSLREKVGLNKIDSPWHNVYIDEEVINSESSTNFGLKLLERIDFTSTYYFLSRVVNAKIADNENKAPKYDSDINKIALSIESFGNMGQTILWKWRKSKSC
jgi:ubiquinone/menaquinone biosynthesis C-methylase UbiE